MATLAPIKPEKRKNTAGTGLLFSHGQCRCADRHGLCILLFLLIKPRERARFSINRNSISIVYENQEKVKSIPKNRRRMQLSKPVFRTVCTLCPCSKRIRVFPAAPPSFCPCGGRGAFIPAASPKRLSSGRFPSCRSNSGLRSGIFHPLFR